MKSKGDRKESTLLRLIIAPIRILTRARDLYIQSLTSGGGHVSYGNSMGCPTPQIPKLPRSLSSQSSFRSAEDELRDLIRLASTRNLKIDAELRRTKSSIPLGGGPTMVTPVPRSRTVGFGRIDEDRAFEFGDDEDVGLLGEVHPIGRNNSVSRRIKVA
ncbi:hypothetical protein ACS0TY_029263 [Phlomoides rotata]